MRLHSIAVLSAITLLASVDATLFPKVSKVSATNFLVRPVNKGTNDVSNQRFLRIHSNDEERMPTVQAIPNIKTISRTALNMLGKHADELGLVKQMALIKQMKYSDSMLSELLIAAKKNPSTEKAATDLQNQLIRAWLEKLEPPENVFKFLMLDRAADNVLSDSQLKLWINYVYTVRKRTGKPQVSLIDNLMNNYNDKAMVKIINTAKKSPDAKAKGTYVEDELLLKWAVDEKPIAYVSKMLGTTAAESYSKALDGFKGVHDKQLRNMLYKHERPQTVFNYLKLDKTDNPFTSPQLNDWVNYATAFKGRTKGNPFAPETNMIDTLMKHIGNDEKVLIKMIKTAKGSDDSNMIVPVHTIEKELIGKWAVAREPLSSVSTKLGTTNADKERLHKIYMDALEEYDTTYLDWMRRYGQ